MYRVAQKQNGPVAAAIQKGHHYTFARIFVPIFKIRAPETHKRFRVF